MTGRCLHEIFADRAAKAPDRIAVTCGAEEISYGDLDARSDRLACLLQAAGTGPGVLVGLCAERGIDLPAGLLAILKAGGAYVPIDPAYPAERIAYLLDDSGVGTVVTTSDVAGRLGGVLPDRIVLADAEPPEGRPVATARDEDLAYVIYTSGSTGAPKGVLVEHRNVVRLLERTEHWFGFGDDDVWTLFHSVSFDFSVWEIWGALLYGGRLVIVPAEVARSPEALRRLLVAEGVTVLNQTPSAFRHLVAADARQERPTPYRLRQVVFGGERLDVDLLGPWIARYGDDRPHLVNMYGITETTVHVTYRRVRKADLDHPELSPIGVPVPDLRLDVLDERGRPATTGNLHVSGPGLARGYLDRPELTAERFAVLPDGGRRYDSGDVVTRLPGGEYAYIGRSDDQVKVRGFRLEPREIELCLLGHPRVAHAVVTHRDYGEGDVRLLAFVVPDGGPGPDLTEQLTERAASRLPAHARPSTYHIVSEIPMTPQGKADRAALARSAQASSAAKVVQRIAEDVLERDEVPPRVDLFDLGATSLAMTRIIAQVNERFGLELTGRELEEEASVACLASCVEERLTVRG
ncbi:thioester reductase [Nonomuraea sp. WAC 01424]|uniref:amino acid adenylation domain-containing protein n=1 Tax=Nonomuraea sp. WAC 01424 TaxID=2203200 RepID=UPI000F78576F|nr:amino acid adenylation domain-containing protein [Nonomuraea sp. WAC 01424]RSM99125.1 thioester reductase [Nonomuraea sp. WAC 01424]